MLDQIHIAAPCNASWKDMEGDERKRHCGSCKLDVYNISDMRAEEAEAFIRASTGHVCVRLYRRPDGTVLTRNCPKGVWMIRRKIAHSSAMMLAAVFTILGFAKSPRKHSTARDRPAIMGKIPAQHPIIEKLDPPPMMGAIACPPIQPPSKGNKGG